VLLLVAIVVAVVVRAFVLQTFYIPSGIDGEDACSSTTACSSNKLIYDFRSPHRGEIIVFEAPANWRSTTSPTKTSSSASSASGDHIVCCDDRQRLIINNHPIDEPYIYSTDDWSRRPRQRQPFDIVVPKGGSG
jgi:signal peptidase I